MKLDLENPALLYLIESSLVAMPGLLVSGGLGLPPRMLELPEGPDEIAFLRAMQALRSDGIGHWHDWDVRHVHRAARRSQERSPVTPMGIGVIDVLAALQSARRYIDQPILDWLTLRDTPTAILESAIPEKAARTLNEYDQSDVELAQAFKRQIIDQTNPIRHQVATGLYWLRRPDLPRVDQEIAYQHLRLYVHARGIVMSIVTKDDWYVPFAWTPEGINTAQIYLHPRATFALDILAACIWRDACVIQERWTQRIGSAHRIGPAVVEDRIRSVTFPRTVYKVQWGNDGENEHVRERILRSHAVRHSYPLLPFTHVAHAAAERAESHGLPEPPPGHTFRAPHVRGQGAPVEPIPQLHCRGLLTASILLS